MGDSIIYYQLIMMQKINNLSLLGKIQKIVQIQKGRYAAKGFKNTLIGIGLLLAMFVVGWCLGRFFWPQEVIQNEEVFVAWRSIAIHTIFQFLVFLIFLPGYMGWSSFYQEYRINKRTSWPWERSNWKQIKAKTIWVLVINEFIIYPLPAYISTFVGLELNFKGFPSLLEVFVQTNLIFFMEDFFFYWFHRSAHEIRSLYKYHKVHHQYDHIFAPVTEYNHPIDYGLASLMPSAICCIILGDRIHAFTLFYYMVHKTFSSGENHCGYQIPWSPFRVLPLLSEVSYHDDHHSINIGNYAGTCYIWDVLFNTTGPTYDLLKGDKKAK